MNRPGRALSLTAPSAAAAVEHSTAGRAGERWRADVLRRRLLAVADLLAAAVAGCVLVVGLREPNAAWAFALIPLWVLLAKLLGLYDRDHRTLRHLTLDEAPTLLVLAACGTAATAGAVEVAVPDESVTIALAGVAWLLTAVAILALRTLARGAWRGLTPRERTLIVGRGPLADAARRKLELFPDMHAVAVEAQGFDVARLRQHVALPDVERIVLASPETDEELIAQLVAACRAQGIKLTVVPPARGMFGTAVQLRHVADLPVVEYNTWDVSRSTLLLKRALDVVVSGLALVVLLPLLLLIAGAIRLDSRGPVLFTQVRAGRGGRPFRMIKFRTMVREAESLLPTLVQLDHLQDPMFKLSDDPRVTRLGRVLRRTSVDELPQLVNVLRGDMSLVGPRPEQVELVARYAPEHRFRLVAKPGLTGPMQVFGRGQLRFDERLAVEREYIENLSIGADLRILGLTASSVLRGRGAF